MATADLFEPLSEQEIKDALERAERDPPAVSQPDLYRVAVDYLEGRQRDDVDHQLGLRYSQTQVGREGQAIAPQTIPLTQRYIAEAANAYNKPVTRTIVVAEDGSENEQTENLTSELRRMLDEANYDETMHSNHKLSMLLGSSGMWYQARKGKLRTVIAQPHEIFPIKPEELTWFSPAHQEDYRAFVVELSGVHSNEKDSLNPYVWVEPSQTVFYRAQGPYTPGGEMTEHANIFEWPQAIDTDDQLGDVRMLPLMPLVIWNRELPTQSVIADVDSAIALTNRELNMQFSILLDTISHQGWSQLVLKTIHGGHGVSQVAVGPRTALGLNPEEDAQMLGSPISYESLVAALQDWVRLFAISMSQSPNDFAIDAQQAASGFAKRVDALPKLEARELQLRRLNAIETQRAWPRLASIGSFLGKLSASVEQLAKLRLKVEFGDVEFPLSVQERVQSQEHDIKHGLTTPAKILAKKDGITVEEAEEIIADNKGKVPQPEAEGQAQPQREPGALLGQLINSRRGGRPPVAEA